MTLALAPSGDVRQAPRLAGLIFVGAAALACWWIGKSTGFPAPVLAAVAGLAFAFTGLAPRIAPALKGWSGPGLKTGVAMLGAQVAWVELAALGLPVAAAGGFLVLSGLGIGTAIGALAGLPLAEALIAASAVSICGASAAMGAASALPGTEQNRRTAAFVVIGVNLLSTIAMIAYPMIAQALGFSERQTGVFLGLAIHDVAQVVAAGHSVSPLAETTAALAKLSRVLWLGPVVMLIALSVRSGSKRFPAPPPFVWGFAGLMLARNLGLIPELLLPALTATSQILLLGGVFAISAQASPRDLLKIDPRLAWTLAAATAVVAMISAAASVTLVS